MSQSAIEWTDATWNPTTGCDIVSKGCGHCYAKTMSRRLQAMGVKEYANGFDFTLHPHRLDIPRRWKKPRMIFVNSMSDLFHEKCPLEYIQRVFAVMRDCPQHTFQILTKRAERLFRLEDKLQWAQNIWIGVSVENEAAKARIPFVAACHEAGVRFLSCEPLLGPLPYLRLFPNINWVIVGGESGPGARPMAPEWARDIRDQCAAQNIPFFFKQWGGARKGKAGRLLDGVEHNAMPVKAEGYHGV